MIIVGYYLAKKDDYGGELRFEEMPSKSTYPPSVASNNIESRQSSIKRESNDIKTFCGKCGNKLIEGDKFCRNCGSSI